MLDWSKSYSVWCIDSIENLHYYSDIKHIYLL